MAKICSEFIPVVFRVVYSRLLLCLNRLWHRNRPRSVIFNECWASRYLHPAVHNFNISTYCSSLWYLTHRVPLLILCPAFFVVFLSIHMYVKTALVKGATTKGSMLHSFSDVTNWLRKGPTLHALSRSGDVFRVGTYHWHYSCGVIFPYSNEKNRL